MGIGVIKCGNKLLNYLPTGGSHGRELDPQFAPNAVDRIHRAPIAKQGNKVLISVPLLEYEDTLARLLSSSFTL